MWCRRWPAITDAVKRRLGLFVYGTLQPDAGTRMGQWIAARAQHVEPATAPGRLHAVRGGDGWFPALVAAKGGARVRGTWCELALAPGELALLDRYEGREYRRVCLPVRTAAGRTARARAYLWRVAVPARCPVIAGGDFLAWLRRTRRRAFSATRGGA